ncbi:hypothetical protein ACET3X_005188 [Alternaria dauci]|uniref:NAD(P)-binding protein n=1 Tax=Alternaria dauci TaxID=48095 RepID=A0ABR3UKV3_9PLEO
MSSTNTVLITGASRGIGKGLVQTYLGHSDTVVVAAVRDIKAAQSLYTLPTSPGSSLIVIEVDVASPESIRRGIQSLTAEHQIDSLDVVVANAAMTLSSPKLSEIGAQELQPSIDANAYGLLELFKAVLPLLRKSKNKGKGKFMYMSSVGASLSTMNNMFPMAAYGASKALGNFFVKWLSLECQDVILWAQHPGMVATDMAKAAFKDLESQGLDLESMALSVEQCCQKLLRLIDDATIETTHGKFLGPDGEELQW